MDRTRLEPHNIDSIHERSTRQYTQCFMERPGLDPPDPLISRTGSSQELPSYTRLQVVDPRTHPGTVELNPISPPLLREVAHVTNIHHSLSPLLQGHLYAADGRMTTPHVRGHGRASSRENYDHFGPEIEQHPHTGAGSLFATSMASVPRLGRLVPARWSQEEIEVELGVLRRSSTESECSSEDDDDDDDGDGNSLDLPNNEIEWEQNNMQETENVHLGFVSAGDGHSPQTRIIEIPSGPKERSDPLVLDVRPQHGPHDFSSLVMPTQEELVRMQELYDEPAPAQGKHRKNKNTEQRKQELEISPAVIAYGPNWTQCRGCQASIVGERRKRTMMPSTASQLTDSHDYYLTNWHKHWSKCKYLHAMGLGGPKHYTRGRRRATHRSSVEQEQWNEGT